MKARMTKWKFPLAALVVACALASFASPAEAQIPRKLKKVVNKEAEATKEKPGQGRWANYDYLRGQRPIYGTGWNLEDTENAPALKPNPAVRVGRIPRNLDFVEGNFQIIRNNGLNVAEFMSKSVFRISLDEPLPEDFSMEFTVQTAAPNQFINIWFEPWVGTKKRPKTYEYHNLRIWRGSGIQHQGRRISGVDQLSSLNLEPMKFRFQVDDGYAILYAGYERIAQVPNFKHPVGSTAIEFSVTANRNLRAYIHDIRVDYGVEDPYEMLMEERAYTTRSIFFDFNSPVLRPESTPELERIRMMLATHRQIEKVLIAGHTDGIGNDDYNLELSKRRAESVKGYLADKGIDGGRIETVGKGESQPVADNETEAGRQMNRRVTLTLP